MSGPLHGVRVIELAHVMAGPVCGLMLADLGADVIKVERAPDGDPARTFVPPELGGESAAFMMANRNKRGIAVDLKRSAGRDVLLRLLEGADVLVENYRPGALARLGLDDAALRAAYPRLVYASISGYGPSGPLAGEGGFDLMAQAYTGLMSVTGEGPEREPVKVGVPISDIGAGTMAALGIVAALYEREQSGRGQRVDTSLFEAGLFSTLWQSSIALATGASPGPMGSAHPLVAPYRAFRAADGWITVGTSNQANWERLPEVVDRPDLLDDPRFIDNAGRVAHREELAAELQSRFRLRPAAEWLEALRAAGIPAAPVLDVLDALRHPQSAARDMVVEVEHPSAGTLRTLGAPIKLDRTRPAVRRAAPLLGEHTREVLRDVGYADAAIDRLAADGAVVVRHA